MVAAYTGEQAVEAMLNTGAFTEAETLLEQLHTTGMPEERWRWFASTSSSPGATWRPLFLSNASQWSG